MANQHSALGTKPRSDLRVVESITQMSEDVFTLWGVPGSGFSRSGCAFDQTKGATMFSEWMVMQVQVYILFGAQHPATLHFSYPGAGEIRLTGCCLLPAGSHWSSRSAWKTGPGRVAWTRRTQGRRTSRSEEVCSGGANKGCGR